MTYGSETRALLADVGLKFESAEIQMIRWMCGVSMKDRRTSEKLRKLVGVSLSQLSLAYKWCSSITAVSNCCANCVETSRPQQWVPDLPFSGQAGHADLLDG